LKTFLKGGEAEEYEGISIEWIRGREAVLTVYEDGNERETVHLYNLRTLDEMHAKMEELGFHKKDQSSVPATKLRKQELRFEEAEEVPDGADGADGANLDMNLQSVLIIFAIPSFGLVLYRYCRRLKRRTAISSQ